MADEQKKDDATVTAGGIRMADRRFRFEKHWTFPGKTGAPPQPFTRPWGSQPMNANLKTGALSGAPHPEQVPIFKDEGAAAKAAETPREEFEAKQAYGR